MAKRSKRDKNLHDNEVKRLTYALRRSGHTVLADLPGFKKPRSIGQNNRVPDIEARKKGRTKLIEVETPKSLKSDREQQSTFRRSAAQKKNTSFRTVVAGKKRR